MAAGLDRNPLDQLDDRAPQFPIGQRGIGLQQPERVWVRNQGERGFDALRRHLVDAVAALEERVDRDVENARDLRETTGADAVRSFLVLLHLLKGHTNALAQLGLRQSGGKALNLDALSNLDIDWIGFSRGHGSLRLGASAPPAPRHRIHYQACTDSASRLSVRLGFSVNTRRVGHKVCNYLQGAPQVVRLERQPAV